MQEVYKKKNSRHLSSNTSLVIEWEFFLKYNLLKDAVAFELITVGPVDVFGGLSARKDT